MIIPTTTQQRNKLKRDIKMYERFKQLYNVEKLRLDVVWDKLQDEFCIDKIQVQRRLKEMNEQYIELAKTQMEINFKPDNQAQ